MFVHQASWVLNSLSLVIQISPCPYHWKSIRYGEVQGEYLLQGDLLPSFRRTKKNQSVLPAMAVSSVPLIQNHMPKCCILR